MSLIINSSSPDPCIYDEKFIITTSNNNNGIFPIWKKENDQWQFSNFALGMVENHPWAQKEFWAPEVHSQKKGQYILVYCAIPKWGKHHALGLASSNAPTGPFIDLGRPLLISPYVGLIDPHLTHQNGKTWLLWKEDGNQLRPLCPTFIKAQELKRCALTGPISTLLTNDQEFEGELVEAPWVLHEPPFYYLFYSCNWFNRPEYTISVARSPKFPGTIRDWEKIGRSIIPPFTDFEGIGHCSLSGQKMVFHGWKKGCIGEPHHRVALEMLFAIDKKTHWPIFFCLCKK